MNEFLEIGKIVSLHGIAGEVKIYPWCDGPSVLSPLKRLYLDEDGSRPLDVRCRTHNTMALCKISGVDTPEAARAYINKVLYAARGDIKLPQGSHFIVDLIGLSAVHAETGETLGTLSDVLPGAANDLYEITTMLGEKRLVPAIAHFVKKTDVAEGKIYILPIKGLLED